MKTSDSIKNIAAALLVAQRDMPHPLKTSTNPHLRSKFADLNSVMDTTKPHLHDAGLVVFQTVGGTPGVDGELFATCTTRLVHAESGEWFEDVQRMPYSEQKGLNTPQVYGVDYTYMRRYGWSAVCGINADSDNDGNEGKGGGEPAKKANPSSDFDL
jgi:hypothetical protein